MTKRSSKETEEEVIPQIVTETVQTAEEYAALKEDFAQILQRGINGFQENTPGRHINYTALRLQGRYGLIVKTNRRGLIEIPEMSGLEVDNQGRVRHQRMYIGMNCNSVTTKNTFTSVTVLRPGETTVKEFEANAGAHELLKVATIHAQKTGEAFQQKVDEGEVEYFPRTVGPQQQTDSVNWADGETDISIDQVFQIIQLARQTLRTELASKLLDCQIVFFHIIDTAEISDTNGNKLDTAVPRTGISIQITTDKKNVVHETIRGVGGMSALLKYDPAVGIEDTIITLAKKAAKYARDLDRSQPCSILGNEAHVLLDGAVSGVLGHEVLGHPSEQDLILVNKKDQDVDLNLKARIGGQVSENSAFGIVDDGHKEIVLGTKTLTHCFGALPYDDDCCPAKRTVLVKNGIQTLALTGADGFEELLDGLQENTVKALKEHGLSGNLRSETYNKPSMIRMTNTYILPNEKGPKTLEKMASLVPKTKKGVYLATCQGGWVDPSTGNFEVTGQLGYLIENGIITDKPVNNIKVHGNISKFGSKIKSIGASETIGSSTGFCGKAGSWVPVEDGGPALLIENASIGDDIQEWLWQDKFTEYHKQTLEVVNKQRDNSEIYFKFVEDATNGESQQHNKICMVTYRMSVEDEVKLLRGPIHDTANYILGPNGTLEEK